MNFLDIVGMSVSNLWRRKLRTFLTVLGVVIGTTSIVVMISLGFGLKAAIMSEMSSYGSMTEITVQRSYGSTDLQLNDSSITEIAALPGVESVSPMLELYVTMSQGKYSAGVSLVGVSQEFLSKIPVGEGRIPGSNVNELEILIGNTVITDFYVTDTYVYPYYEKGELANVDLLNKPVFTKLENTGYTGPDGEWVEIPSKKNVFPIVGKVEGDVDSWNSYSYRAYTDIDALKLYLSKTYKGKPIPGQPLDKNGRPFKEMVYSSCTVAVESADQVETILQNIKDMGFNAYSQAEWIEQTEKELLIIEAVLGGIGAIAFFVAAIGIANTMMMSTYERTKEIGVMKVLGCSLPNIRTLFLCEAAAIGVLGGLIGLGISYGLSGLCNSFLPELMGYGDAKISLIPWWLAVGAVGFAALVGMVAGFFPAQRATKLSPLAAIRNE